MTHRLHPVTLIVANPADGPARVAAWPVHRRHRAVGVFAAGAGAFIIAAAVAPTRGRETKARTLEAITR